MSKERQYVVTLVTTERVIVKARSEEHARTRAIAVAKHDRGLRDVVATEAIPARKPRKS